jgi:hypothetical protein
MTAAALADKLHATKVRGGWVALCPAHSERSFIGCISKGGNPPVPSPSSQNLKIDIPVQETSS